ARTAIDFIDATSNTSIQTLSLGATAPAIAITPHADLALVALQGIFPSCTPPPPPSSAPPASSPPPSLAPGPRNVARVVPEQTITHGQLVGIDVASRTKLTGVPAAIDANPMA